MKEKQVDEVAASLHFSAEPESHLPNKLCILVYLAEDELRVDLCEVIFAALREFPGLPLRHSCLRCETRFDGGNMENMKFQCRHPAEPAHSPDEEY